MNSEQGASLSRIWWLAAVVLFSALHASAAQECDALEGEDLTVCLTLMVCMGLEENKARNQCLEVARQVLDDHDAQKSQVRAETAEESPHANVLEAVREETQDDRSAEVVESPALATPVTETAVKQSVDRESSVAPMTAEEHSADATPPTRRSRWFSWIRRGENRNPKEVDDEAGFTIDGVPKQFAATVVSVSKAGYNDAMLVLSNGYLFIVKRVRQSGIEPGDVIVARKKEGLSRRDAFLFYGRGASVDASRIACDHVDPSRTTRKRCEYAARQLGFDPR